MDGKVGVYFILHRYPSLPHNKEYLPADNSLRYSPLVQYPIQINWLYQQCFRLKTFVLLF